MAKSNSSANRLNKHWITGPLRLLPFLLLSCSLLACAEQGSLPEILLEGDSLSVPYPGSFASELQALLGNRAAVTSLARTGDTVYELLYQPVPRPRASHSIAILWAGTNDLNQGAEAETVFLNLVSEAKRFRQRGWQVLVMTSIQRQSRVNDPQKDTQRVKFNNLIRHYPQAKAPWSKVIDVAALPEFSDLDNTVTGNLDIYYPDGVHLSGGGKVLARRVSQTMGF